MRPQLSKRRGGRKFLALSGPQPFIGQLGDLTFSAARLFVATAAQLKAANFNAPAESPRHGEAPKPEPQTGTKNRAPTCSRASHNFETAVREPLYAGWIDSHGCFNNIFIANRSVSQTEPLVSLITWPRTEPIEPILTSEKRKTPPTLQPPFSDPPTLQPLQPSSPSSPSRPSGSSPPAFQFFSPSNPTALQRPSSPPALRPSSVQPSSPLKATAVCLHRVFLAPKPW